MSSKPLRYLATAAVCALVTSPAVAQNMLNGDLAFELGRNFDKGRNFKHISTSLGTTFNSGLGFQLDLAVGKYEAVNSTSPSAAVHVYYAPDANWAVGAFISGEDQRPGNYVYMGLEAAYMTGAFKAEAYAAYRRDVARGFHGDRYGVEMSYAPDTWNGFGVFGGAHAETGLPAGYKAIAYVGGDYRFDNGTKLALTVGQTNLGETVATFGYHVQFGNGATFSRRHSQGVYDGY